MLFANPIALPRDLEPPIFSYLSLEDLQCCRPISKLWREFATNVLIERGVPKKLVNLTIRFAADIEMLKEIFSQFIKDLAPKEKNQFIIYFPLHMERFRLQASWTGLDNQGGRFSIELTAAINDFPIMSDTERDVTNMETHRLIGYLGSRTSKSSKYFCRNISDVLTGSCARLTTVSSHGVTEFRGERSMMGDGSTPLWEIVTELQPIQENELEKIREEAFRKEEIRILKIVICIIAAIVYTIWQLSATLSRNKL